MAALLSGLPTSVPGFAIDRMCAGAMTAVTTTASGIAFGAYDVVIAGGVEHMGHHPMGEGVDPNPRIVAEKLVDPSALVMGSTAENLHDRYPDITRERSDAFAVGSQRKLAEAYDHGKIQPDLVPIAVRHDELGWGLATADEPPRRGTTADDLAALKTPFRPHGKVTAGNAAGLNDGATACIWASARQPTSSGSRPACAWSRMPLWVSSRGDGHRSGPVDREGAAAGRAVDRRTSGCSSSTRPLPCRCWLSSTTSASRTTTTG
jgi:acetyl-CoA acyltransferase